jgi:predicted nucleotidyltransferase
MDLQTLLEQKREQVLETAARYGAYDVRVFGSVARNEANDASDIDILVNMEPGRSLMDLGAYSMICKSFWGLRSSESIVL